MLQLNIFDLVSQVGLEAVLTPLIRVIDAIDITYVDIIAGANFHFAKVQLTSKNDGKIAVWQKCLY